MRRSQDFREVIRHGRRARHRFFMVHYKADQRLGGLVGFIVPKRAIALASDRNRIKRRLRHIATTQIKNNRITDEDALVVRVFSPALHADFTELASAFESSLADVKNREASKASPSKRQMTKEVVQ